MERQLSIENKEIKTCLFSGHRILDEDFSLSSLSESIDIAIKKGAEVFYNGMAKGFDLFAGEEILKRKKTNKNIKFIACVPFYGQEKSFSEEDKNRYAKILKCADEIIYLSNEYFRGCMQMRNRFMAEKGDILICYCKKKTGGTAYTVKYFQKKYPEKEILFL